MFMKKKDLVKMRGLDRKNELEPDEIVEELVRRINNLTGVSEVIRKEDKVIFTTRDMTFATIIKNEDNVVVKYELDYDRILDMNGKCKVKPYATEDKLDIVTYEIKTKFDMQYATSIAQQSFMYRKRLKK